LWYFSSFILETVLTNLQDLPPRPGYGTDGRPVTVFANHYRLTNIPAVKVYQYAFTIPTKDGDAPTKGMATAIWGSKEVKDALGEHHDSLIFNGIISSIHR